MLNEKKCDSKSPKLLDAKAISSLAVELGNGWKVVHEHHLEKEYPFKDFKEALHFTVQVGELSEKEGHHPDIHLAYGRVRLILWTHSLNGLSENDFILASKCDQIGSLV